MATMIICFLLGAIAMGMVLYPLLRGRPGAPVPTASAEAAQPPPKDGSETGSGSELMLFGYPRKQVIIFGAIAAVLVAAAGLYFATGDKPASSGLAGAGLAAAGPASAAGAPGAPPALPDVDTMMTRLEKRLETKPNDPDGWRMLGWSYYATQKYDQSVRAYGKAVALKPGSAAFQSAYGEAVTKAAGDKVTTEAQAAFRKALAIDPKDARARIYMARLRHEGGDSKGALEDLFNILHAQTPDSSEAVAAKEAILKVSAASGINVADRLPPEVKPAAAPAAPALTSGGIPGPTAAQVQAAQQLSPQDQQSMVEGMVSKLETRLKTSPKDADGWIMLIRSRKQMGQDDRARAALSLGLAAFADDAAARARISEAARSYGVR
jgi:cytochrome c-type biogenesis protein CcmH